MSKKKTNLKTSISSPTPKVTIGQLANGDIVNTIASLMTQETSVKAAYELITLKNELTNIIKGYEELRIRLIQKYGKKTASGEVELNADRSAYLLDNQEEFDRDFKELLNTEVFISRIPLSYIEKLVLTPLVLQTLVNTVIIA